MPYDDEYYDDDEYYEDEGYYEDDGYYEDEYYDDDEYYEDEYWEEEYWDEDEFEESMRNRLILIMTSSYGISILAHVVLLILLASVVIFYQEEQEEAEILARREFREQEYDEELERDMHRSPEIQDDRQVERPIRELEEEVVETQDIPQGTDMNNMANKNLESTSVVDAYGVGGGAAGAYGHRFGQGSLTAEGGSAGTESAVLAALRWLARHQSEDGRWDTDEFYRNCQDSQCSGPSNHPDEGGPGSNGPGRGYEHFDAGNTGLAILAFLGQGHTHQFGSPEFREVVRKAIIWLVGMPGMGSGIQEANGSIGYHEDDPSTDINEGESIYNHAIATMAICEAYAMTRDPMLKPKAESAIEFCLQSQNRGYGWRYGVSPGDNDTSVTGWMVLALKAAKVAELEVPQDAFDDARSWFDRTTVGFDAQAGRFDDSVDGAGEVGYMQAGDGGSFLPPQEGRYVAVPTMTAVAVICRIFTGQRRSEDVIQAGADVLMGQLPQWGSDGSQSLVNMYYWYYGTYAMFQVGGDDWLTWNDAMQQSLLDTQRMGGDEDGSWDPVGDWGIAGGRVYSTAIGALTLEIYYRYERAQSGGGGG